MGRDRVLSLRKPQDLETFSVELVQYVERYGLVEEIQDKKFVKVEGWKYAGANFGLKAIVSEPELRSNLEPLYIFRAKKVYKGNEYEKTELVTTSQAQKEEYHKINPRHLLYFGTWYSYRCGCEIRMLSTDKVVSTGYGSCSNMEPSKWKWEEYAVESMAQTRAIGKAYRNLLGYLMNIAGFEDTPAEEMDEIKVEQQTPTTATTQTVEIPQSDKMKAGPKAWTKILEKYKTGDVDRDTINLHYQLTDDQVRDLDQLENAKM